MCTPCGKREEQVCNVLEFVRGKNLVFGPRKGKMFLQCVEVCGSILEDGTRTPARGEMAALQLWERPKSITQLRALVGCCNYYHEFLPLYTTYSGPMTEVLKVGKVEGNNGPQAKYK